jgi:glycosyltransferase involved in cell wall biosynthesis
LASALRPAWSEHLRTLVTALQLEDRIEFAGEKESLDAEYQNADIFVLPSRFEGYGMVFSEALAAGLPIVAARAGAVPDVVPPEAGILVPPDDSTALATVLAELLTQPPRRRELQRGAQAAAAFLPRWEDTARAVASLIEELCA